jgi:hypothetical protein
MFSGGEGRCLLRTRTTALVASAGLANDAGVGVRITDNTT